MWRLCVCVCVCVCLCLCVCMCVCGWVREGGVVRAICLVSSNKKANDNDSLVDLLCCFVSS